MSKAFVKEDAPEPETSAHLPNGEAPAAPAHGKNYITAAGFARLQSEKKQLLEVERPEVVRTVAWAASLGDRSENADYIYGKRRLREIDRRVRFLIKRLEAAQIVHASGRDTDQIFFGARVRVRGASGERTVTIVDFVIIALVIFLMVKMINHYRRKAEKELPAAPPPRQEQLLEEIRDLLKRK